MLLRSVSSFDPSSAVPRNVTDRPASWRRLGVVLLALLLAAASLNATAADKKTRNALIGAGIGAAGGALISHGDAWSTIGGAAAGGLIGAVVTKDKHHHGRRRGDRGYDHDRGYGRDQRRDRGGRYGH